jgi:DNA replication ATP-dependent helicase Dna2
MLYTLLLSDRYSQPVPAGLLFYTQAEDVKLVHPARNEIRSLIIMRNDIANWLMKRTRLTADDAKPIEEAFLPQTIDDERICPRCYALDACMLYRKVKCFSLFLSIACLFSGRPLRTSKIKPRT